MQGDWRERVEKINERLSMADRGYLVAADHLLKRDMSMLVEGFRLLVEAHDAFGEMVGPGPSADYERRVRKHDDAWLAADEFLRGVGRE